MELELSVVQQASPTLGYVAGLAISDLLVVVAGGTTARSPTVLASSNARHFALRKTPRELGLRDALVTSDALWTCGEYGQLALSRDRGATWTVIDTSTERCLFGLAQAAGGAVWVVGDEGYVGRVVGERVERMSFDTTARLTALYRANDDLIALGYDGTMYRHRAGTVTRVATGATKQLTALAITNKGSWLVTGDGGFLARSPDGSWFSRVKLGVDVDLESIAVLADGRIVIVGDRGVILVSIDDGRTWTTLETDLAAHLWTVRRFGTGVLIGGDDGLILKLAPPGDETWADRADIFGGKRQVDAILAQVRALSAHPVDDEDDGDADSDDDDDAGGGDEDSDDDDDADDDDDDDDDDDEAEGNEDEDRGRQITSFAGAPPRRREDMS
jgi:photosystem II stability/assembly factor-like uncharacterized protein